MGCGTSTATNGPYPRQQYHGGGRGGPQQRGMGYPGNQPMMVNNSNNDRMAEGMIAGAAVGYMAGSAMGGGYHNSPMGMPMGTELPMGYHVGPTIGQPSLEVMGVDVI